MITPQGSGFLLHFKIRTGGGTNGKKKRRKVYRTKDVYEALRIARLKVDEISIGFDTEAVKLREVELKRAEKEVRERLQEQYGYVQGFPAPDKGLSEFVSALRFDDELSDIRDMEQILLILLIDEWTDG